jgi:hypothetical protein
VCKLLWIGVDFNGTVSVGNSEIGAFEEKVYSLTRELGEAKNNFSFSEQIEKLFGPIEIGTD